MTKVETWSFAVSSPVNLFLLFAPQFHCNLGGGTYSAVLRLICFSHLLHPNHNRGSQPNNQQGQPLWNDTLICWNLVAFAGANNEQLQEECNFGISVVEVYVLTHGLMCICVRWITQEHSVKKLLALPFIWDIMKWVWDWFPVLIEFSPTDGLTFHIQQEVVGFWGGGKVAWSFGGWISGM